MKRFSLAVLFALFATAPFAQSGFSFGSSIINTLGEFDKYIPSTPVGIYVGLMLPITESGNILAGADVGVSMYAGDSYTQELLLENETQEIEVYEEDCFFHYTALIRYQPFSDVYVNPYVEFRAGGTSFFSTIITEEEYGEYFDDQSKFHGTSFQTGLGGGLVVNLEKIFNSENLFSLDFGATYLMGSRTEYRNMALDHAPGKSLDEAKYESTTDNINFRFGVLLHLW